jgi:hypothetical protein
MSQFSAGRLLAHMVVQSKEKWPMKFLHHFSILTSLNRVFYYTFKTYVLALRGVIKLDNTIHLN